MDELIGLAQACDVIGCSYSKGLKLAKAGTLPFKKIGANWLIPRSTLYSELGLQMPSNAARLETGKKAVHNMPPISEREELLDRIQMTLEKANAALEAAELSRHKFHDAVNECVAQMKELDVLFERAKESRLLGHPEGFDVFTEECRKTKASTSKDS